MQIVQMTRSHWPEVHRIYQDGMDTGLATFETVAPEWVGWDKKFLRPCRLVAMSPGVVGWAALQPVSTRPAYQGVAEISLYVDVDHSGQRIGSQLMDHLIQCSEKNGIYMLTASIFEENKVSIHLHQRFGFRVVGVRERISKRGALWVNTVILDRRSASP